MAVKDRTDLTTQAEEIRDEVVTGANTATRVGTMHKDAVDSNLNKTDDPYLEDVVEGVYIIIDKSDPKNPIIAGTGESDTVVESAKVNEAAGISIGQIVYLSGATGGFPQVSLASNDDYDKAEVLAMANETAANNQTISVTILGIVEGIDTSLYTEGQILYLGTNGNITGTHPSGLDAVVRVGKAVKINPSTGSIGFRPNPLIAVDDLDGVVRQQIVNRNSGTQAIVNTTLVNDLGHYLSVNMQGSNHAFGSSEAVWFNIGYGASEFINDGNKGFVWYTDVGDTHDFSYTEKMRLSPAGDLSISGTVDGVDVGTDVPLNTTHRGSDGKDHSDVVLNNTHRGSDGKDHSDVVLNNTHRQVVTGNPHAVDFAELPDKDTAYQAVHNESSAAGVVDLDMSISSVIALTLTEDITSFSFSNNPSIVELVDTVIHVYQDATGGWAINFAGCGAYPPEDKPLSGDIQPAQTALAHTQYWLNWSGTYWSISLNKMSTTAL